MRIRRKLLPILKWLAVVSIVSLLLTRYTLRSKQRLKNSMPNGARVPVSIRATVKKLSQSVIEAKQRVHTEFISLVNIFQGEGYMQSRDGNTETEITWCSFGDEKHLHYVSKIAAFWDGPISIAVFTYGSKIPYALKYLAALRHCDDNVKRKVRFHLSIPKTEVGPYVKNMLDDLQTTNLTCEILQQKLDGALANYADQNMPFPNNYLRNVALKNANTSHVINVDIDYTPSENLREKFLNFIIHHGKSIKPKTAFVLPCFESSITPESPLSRDELLERWEAGTIRQFHVLRCKVCQLRTHYKRWSSLKVPQTNTLRLAYPVTYLAPWEPYFIVRKDEVPDFDERFRGFGFNRVSQICEMYMRGFKFYVVDNGFIIHDGFEGGTWSQLRQMKMDTREKNKGPYGAMKRELKKRYPNKVIGRCR